MTKKTNYTIVGVLFTYLMINMGARKSNNANQKKQQQCVYVCREKKKTILCVSSSLCVSK
jgi:hypothetical protein